MRTGYENSAAERVAALREKMREKNISVYIIPTADFHGSEYVSDYFKERAFITGFTGSAGTAVITLEEAGLWTDGRYYIQAEKQLAGSGITLCRAGMEGVPKVSEFVEQKLSAGMVLGFDGRTVAASEGEAYLSIAGACGASVITDVDLVGEIWPERPAFPIHPAFVLEEQYAGESTVSKIKRIRKVMAQEGADYHVLSCLYDIAWVLNVRGDDIPHVPVVMSYLLIGREECFWYVKPEVFEEACESSVEFSDSAKAEEGCGRKAYEKHPEFRRGDALREYLDSVGVQVRAYDAFYTDLETIETLSQCTVRNGDHAQRGDKPGAVNRSVTVMLEKEKVNLRILDVLADSVTVIDRVNPEEKMKAVKNPTELDNIRRAHVKDGVAVTKFLYWLKTNIGKEKITEWSAADYLEQLRSEQEGFLDISFDTISAYGPNAAMMHYAPSKEHEVVLEEKGFLLVDSGGHYLEGSTDITRNIVLGELTLEEKQMFTAVVRACLNLSNARFLYGCCGQNLDILARGPLWQQGLDYRCGTGHGNGYLLNVHEGPNGFRWRIVPERRDNGTLEEGMVTTDEPGVYIEGKYGIRIENELICKKWEKNEYGQFMEFENITYAPIDLDAILPEEMTKTERGYLNLYHKKVYEVIAPHLTGNEREWLEKYTREI